MNVNLDLGYTRTMETNKRTASKVTVLVASISLAILGALGISNAYAGQEGAVATKSSAPSSSISRQTAAKPTLVEVDGSVVSMPEEHITVAPPQKSWTMPKKANKVWTCSGPRALVQGPVAMTVRDCEWR